MRQYISAPPCPREGVGWRKEGGHSIASQCASIQLDSPHVWDALHSLDLAPRPSELSICAPSNRQEAILGYVNE